ncbi:MAG: CPBP family intramembrane metalloprotease [Bacilli bacterium]|nr:CPBP family intramembrane metalloprotease [Bacilli bacterium]
MKHLKKYKKQIIGSIMFILMFLISDLILLLLIALGLDVESLSSSNKTLISLGISLVFPIILIMVYRKDLFKDLKKIKKEYKSYLDYIINYYTIGVIGMVLINLFLQYGLKLGLAGNEESVRNLLIEAPLYTFISACILAPFQEEMLFRKVIRDFCKNKYVFIIVSGLIFGLMHVLGTASGLEYLYLLPYGFLGSMFALMYVKTDNIWCPIFIHFFHNTLLVLIQLKVNGII